MTKLADALDPVTTPVTPWDSAISFSQAMFSYSEHPLNRSLGLPFDYNGTLDILITPGQKGILIFWFEKSLLVSGNAGERGPGLGPPSVSPRCPLGWGKHSGFFSPLA